jgi:RIO kinase 1
MPRLNPKLFLDEDYELYADRRKLTKDRPQHKIKRPPVDITSQAEGIESASFTYNASRHERMWIMNSLKNFYDLQWFSDVLRLVKGGKEASVYLCVAGSTVAAPYLAAKIYRPRKFRNLKNDHLYREGRADLDADGTVILDDGMLHAMRKRTAFGMDLLHASWIEHEVKTLEILHQAGADVPVPYAAGDNAILMEFIGSDETAAPGLNSVDLEPAEARRIFTRVLNNIELMLAHDRVHGDLSAYNILYWNGRIKLIDFPQAVSPHENHNAYRIFVRDVSRVCEYFLTQGVRCNPRKIALDLWNAYRFPSAPEIDPRWLDDKSEADVAYWKKSRQR